MRETFSAWQETLETFVLEVIFGERHDWKARLARALLLHEFHLIRAERQLAERTGSGS